MKTVAVTGHRPDKLWGYDLLQPKYQALRRALSEELDTINAHKGISGIG